jgi:integrase
MVRLSGILQVAVEHGLIPANPVRGLRKVPAEPRDEVRPLTPAQLEALIDRFAGRDRVIVVLAGQLGLRPQEIRKVPWHGFNGATLTIGRAHTKASARRARTIDVPTATAAHLHRWQLESGRPLGDRPIVGPMTESALTQWGWKHLGPAVHKLTGRDDVTCYTLRHTHASALHYCGYTVPAAARRLGHSGQVHLGYYAHVIDALEGRPQHANLDALIAAARNESSAGVPPLFRKAAKNT